MCATETTAAPSPGVAATTAPPTSTSGRAGWLAPLAAGVFLGVLAFDALPMAHAALGAGALLWAGAGFALIGLASRAARSKSLAMAAWVATLGVWLHSLLEGVAVGAGAQAAGVLLAISLVVHLVPESTALFAVLTESGVRTTRAFVRCAFTWVLVVAGFVGAQTLAQQVPARPLGMAMGLAAGIFAYLAWVIWQQRNRRLAHAWLGVLAGIVWVAVLHM